MPSIRLNFMNWTSHLFRQNEQSYYQLLPFKLYVALFRTKNDYGKVGVTIEKWVQILWHTWLFSEPGTSTDRVTLTRIWWDTNHKKFQRLEQGEFLYQLRWKPPLIDSVHRQSPEYLVVCHFVGLYVPNKTRAAARWLVCTPARKVISDIWVAWISLEVLLRHRGRFCKKNFQQFLYPLNLSSWYELLRKIKPIFRH